MNNTYSGSSASNAITRGPILQQYATFTSAATCEPTTDPWTPYHLQYFDADILVEKIVVTVKPGYGDNMYVQAISWSDYNKGEWIYRCQH